MSAILRCDLAMHNELMSKWPRVNLF